MMDKSEFIGLCGPYALGALDDIDAIRFRAAMLHADAEMRAALRDALLLAEQLSLAAPEAAPSPAVKDRLMARVGAARAGAKRARAISAPLPVTAPKPARHAADGTRFRRESFFVRLFGAWLAPRPGFAAAFSLGVLAVGLVAYTVSLRDTVTQQRAGIGARDGLIAQLADSLADAEDVRATLVALRNTLARKEALLALLRCPAMREIALAAPPPTDSGLAAAPATAASATRGKLMWDPDHGFAVLQVSLPREPDDKDYQLWMIRGGKPVSAGIFHVESAPDSLGALYRLDALSPMEAKNQDAFAVTLEPKGGMSKPTGAMVLSGGLEI